MSRNDDLIVELCPEGVEFKALGDVGQFMRGNGLQKKDLITEGVGAIHYGQIYTHYGTATSVTKSFVSPSSARNLRRAKCGDLVVATTSENDEDVCRAVAWLGDQAIAISGDAYVYAHGLDPLYVAYFFQTDAFRSQKSRFITGTKVKRVSGTDLARIRIPVPPVEIQREIVRILTKMEQLEAELEAELKAELEARGRQYEFYRDQLLTFTEGEMVRWVTLGDVARFTYGFTARAADFGDYRFIRITDITDGGKLASSGAKYVKSSPEATEYLVKSGDLLVARTGATFGKTVLIDRAEPSVYASFLIRVELDRAIVAPGYYWHFAQSSGYWRQAERIVGRGGQPQFNANVLKRVEFPIPPLHEQERIVGLLDSFGSRVSELSSSLPTELDARRKQYEYYRDHLLTFEEAFA